MQKSVKRRVDQKPPRKKRVPASRLKVIQANVAGIDIGSREMFVCGPADSEEYREVRAFATTTGQIEACVEWLQELGVVSVAMESTGVYWIPVLEILESSGVEVILADTRPVSRVKGREKSDAEDAQWLQTLHRHGLVQGAHRPSQPVSELRTIVRQKLGLVQNQADFQRRMQKCLDQMNVRVHHAVRQLTGVSGMNMLRAMVAGERDPEKLAEHREPGCKKSKAEMIEFLKGNWRSDHLFNLERHLKMYDTISQEIEIYEKEIQRRMEELTPAVRKEEPAPVVANPEKRKTIKKRGQEEKRQKLYRAVGVDLTAIDGVGVETAGVLLSEYGVDISKFPSEKEFVKHIGLAPYQPVSGGKVLKKSRKKEKGTRTAQALRTAATALKQSHSALGAYFRRLERRKNTGIAIFSTARKIAQQIYRMLRSGQGYLDIGQAAYEQRYQAVRFRAIERAANQQGFQLVKMEPVTI